MLSFDQFIKALTLFLEKEVFVNFSSIMQFLGHSFISAAHKEAFNIFTRCKNNKIITSLGIIDKDDNINIDKLYQCAVDAISKTKTVDLGVFSLDAKGLETLYKYLKDMEQQ